MRIWSSNSFQAVFVRKVNWSYHLLSRIVIAMVLVTTAVAYTAKRGMRSQFKRNSLTT